MDSEVSRRLLEINREFYDRFADDFSATRFQPQPGYGELAEYLPNPCPRLLDAACGNGRLGTFLQERDKIRHYVGVDSSSRLLEVAKSRVAGEFFLRELAEPGPLRGLGRFDAICCLAALQHIPGLENRSRLMQEFVGHLDRGGRVIISTWQFLDSPRQMKKVVEWQKVSLSPEDVEADDYLMTWGGDETAIRYVSYIDHDQVSYLSKSAGLRIVHQFRCDGKEGDLNLYSVLEN